jgi:hypothetical protein
LAAPGADPPPLFLPARTLILVFGSWMTVPDALLVLSPRRRHSSSPCRAKWAIVPQPALDGGYYRRRASTLALPPWESYGFDMRAPEVFS